LAQIDILLGGLPKEYDIVVDKNNSFDIVLDERYHSYDVYIYNLTDRQGIYGDELDPLIFRLTQNEVDCLIDVNLLSDKNYSYLALNGSKVEVDKKMLVALREQILKLKSNVDMALVKTADVEPNELKLLTSGEVTNTTRLNTAKLSARLTDRITANMSKVVELLLNTSGTHWFDGYLYEYDDWLLSDMDLIYPKLSLVTTCGKVYMKFTFDIGEHDLHITSEIADFVSNVDIKNVVRNTLQLSDDADFSYQIICSCKQNIFALKNPEISISISSLIYPKQSLAKLSNQTLKEMEVAAGLGVVSQTILTTFMVADEMEAYYGLGHYDNRYLYQWDNHTIHNMGAAVVTTPQSGSVDM